MVPNPGFEQDTACPNQTSQIYKLKYWFTSNGTPDYYNKCYYGVSNNADIPLNVLGYQDINVNCHSYAGINNSLPGTLDNVANEIISVKLNDSLTNNTKYFFSMKVSLSNNSKYATNKFGAFFSKFQPVITNTRTPTNFSQITFSQTISDTLNWIDLKGSFVTDSNYKYISLGNFYDSTSTIKFNANNSGFPYSYYYIDDVCLSNDSIFTYNYSFNCPLTSLSDLDHLKADIDVFPNPSNNYVYIRSKDGLEFSARLFDSFGNSLNTNFSNNALDLSALQSGMYFIEITSGKNVVRKKVVINK